MSRHDGRFPPYVRLDLDPDNWPDGYFDQNLRCGKCGVRWPCQGHFAPSPCCNEKCFKESGPPDMRWPDAVKLLLEYRFDAWYEKWNDGMSDEQLVFEDVKTNGEYDEAKALDEIGRFLDNVRSG